MPSVTWQCPQCGRRVPNRVAECHCGMSRDQALSAPPPARPSASRAAAPARARIAPAHRFSWRTLPGEVKLMAIGLVVVLLAGIGFLFVPWKPKPVVPLLGWSEPTSGRRPSPSPPRSASPRPSPAAKKSWLPW